MNRLDPKADEEPINLDLIYPVVVLAGEMYECRQTRRDVDIRAANHIVFVRRVESKFIRGEIFIDFIREAFLPRYLGIVEKEFRSAEARLKRNRRLVRRNVMREMRALAKQRIK